MEGVWNGGTKPRSWGIEQEREALSVGVSESGWKCQIHPLENEAERFVI